MAVQAVRVQVPLRVPNGTRGQFRPLVFFGTSQDLTNPEDELDWFREDRSCNFLLSVEAFLSAVCFPGEGPKAEAKEDLSPK